MIAMYLLLVDVFIPEYLYEVRVVIKLRILLPFLYKILQHYLYGCMYVDKYVHLNVKE
jgi:hypothetical protein